MPLQKDSFNINFAMGLDTKSDPNQIKPGTFLSLVNSVFTKGEGLFKRNGFGTLPALPNANFGSIRTLGDDLVAMGDTLNTLTEINDRWVTQGKFQNMILTTEPTVVTNNSSNVSDTAIAPNGNMTVVTVDGLGAYFTVLDADARQTLVKTTTLEATATNPRVRSLGAFFIVLYTAGTNLRYVTINATTFAVSAPVTLQGGLTGSVFNAQVSPFDGSLYWAALVGANWVIGILTSVLGTGATTSFATTATATAFSTVAIDPANGRMWFSYWNSATTIFSALFAPGTLATVLAATAAATTGANVSQMTSVVSATNVLTVLWSEPVSYFVGRVNRIIQKARINSAGASTGAIVMMRGVGLWSQAFIEQGKIFVGAIARFSEAFHTDIQPTYFIIDVTADTATPLLMPAFPVAKLAYGNAGGVFNNVLSNANVNGPIVKIGYLKAFQTFADSTLSVGGGPPTFVQLVGAALATLDFTRQPLQTAETEGALHIPGGLLWMFDDTNVVEHGFNMFPEGLNGTAGTAGSMASGIYNYVAVYQWLDAAGNIHQSAPSENFFSINVTGPTGSVSINVPTYRQTMKSGVRIAIYRRSVTNPVFQEVTHPNSLPISDASVDFITFVDTLSETLITGNRILYTNGGVVPDIGAPASTALVNYRARVFLLDSEDKSLLWFSKQNIESVPVEFSDLFTIFIPETNSSQTPTGKLSAICPMDDKLIIFKESAIYYLVGSGPDNTGAGNDFSDPIYIQSTVGCSNAKSLVLTPLGLMFQSNKGIWLLGRDLQTKYIGQPVEGFNNFPITSAVCVPGTTQVRFTLSGTNQTLMFDYLWGQWGQFSTTGFDSVIYQGQQTLLGTDQQSIAKETPGTYLDALVPVVMSFTTGWINLAGLQGYERAYFFYILAKYFSPHILTVGVAFDYDPTIQQTVTIKPDNFGQANAVEDWRVFFSKQKCEAFQLTVTETFDPSLGAAASQGLFISGLNVVIGAKSGYPRRRASHSAG